MKMKKLAGAVLAGGIAFTGMVALPHMEPTKVEAASSYGVSVNTTKQNFYQPEAINFRVKNDNTTYEVGLKIQPQILKDGQWVNEGDVIRTWALPEEYFGMTISTDGSQDWYGHGVDEKGTYRLQVDIDKTTATGSVPQGTFYTDIFYVK